MSGLDRAKRRAEAADRHVRLVDRLLVGVLGVGVLVGVGLILRWLTAGLGPWDLRTLSDVATWRGRTTIEVAKLASLCGRSWVVVILAVAAAGLLRRSGRAGTPLRAALIAIAGQNLVKVIVRRPRPPIRHLEHVTSWSFPSGHATDSTALLVGVLIVCWPLLRSPWRRAVTALAATGAEVMIAGSRLVLGVHYPTDVGAGIVLGAVAAAFGGVQPGLLSRAKVSWRS